MNKRQHSSTASELTDNSLLDSSVFETSKGQKSKKDSKKKKIEPESPKQNSMAETLTIRSIESRLDEISSKLSTVLTKDDTSIIRSMIKETFDELKDKLLSSVVKRLEIIECNVFDQTNKMESLNSQITIKDTEIQDLKTKLNDSEKRAAEMFNEHEQYSRRNNLRITGLHGDTEFQSSIAVTEQVTSLLSTKLGLRVEKEDIDIAHRIGKYSRDKIRPVIVRFVRRQQNRM